jgi:hypothetical protein
MRVGFYPGLFTKDCMKAKNATIVKPGARTSCVAMNLTCDLLVEKMLREQQ